MRKNVENVGVVVDETYPVQGLSSKKVIFGFWDGLNPRKLARDNDPLLATVTAGLEVFTVGMGLCLVGGLEWLAIGTVGGVAAVGLALSEWARVHGVAPLDVLIDPQRTMKRVERGAGRRLGRG